MIDPRIALAFSVRQGTHAILLGSGVSRAAGIPTGWEVLLDLISQVAALEKADAPDPAVWYREQFKKEPHYSEVLEALAPAPAERAQILRGYFEPTEEDREEGRKLPSAAHQAVARLVAGGYVRVMVTTNFDRLLEQALQAAGVEPVVVSSAAQASGAPPLAQVRALVLKVNGDYLDLRTRNTGAELSRYERPMARLISQVVDEFGLIVCGWSADWDEALRTIIAAAPSRRYTTYWAHRSRVTEAADQLIVARGAVKLEIPGGADAFFPDLGEKVETLAEMSTAHPLSVASAVATVKRHVVEPTRRIRLNDYITAEVNRVLPLLSDDAFPVGGPAELLPELGARLGRYESITEILQAALATGAYWGEDAHCSIWADAIERVANWRTDRNGMYPWITLLRYPATLLLYAGGVGSVAARRFDTLRALLATPAIRQAGQEDEPAGVGLQSYVVLEGKWQSKLPGLEKRRFPLSEHLEVVLREPLRHVVPDDARFSESFDRYEYLAALWSAGAGKYLRGSPGAFVYRRANGGNRMLAAFRQEADAAGATWPPLVLFDGSIERYQELHDGLVDWVSKAWWELGL